MNNPQTYISHQLNNSKTKQTHLFPKSIRFPKFHKLNTQVSYDLPSTKTKRTCSFGYGSKTSLATKTVSPPPGTYTATSQFETKNYMHTPSIGVGRDRILFGSFLEGAIQKSKNLPSPNKYNPKIQHSTVGGRIGERIKTQPNLKYQKSIPGPGTYKLNITEMNHSGSYILSNFKNHISPRYYTTSSIDKPKQAKMACSISYDVEEKQVGKYYTSKFKNIITRTFPKAERPGMDDKSKKYIPGFKYRRFSEFGGENR